MSFLSLLFFLSVGVLVASFITSFLRGIILVISAVGICFYLFFATIEQKNFLDNYSKNLDLQQVTSFEYIQKLENYIKETIMGMSAEKLVNEAESIITQENQ